MNSSNRGLTLIELMVALALLGLAATMLASGMRIGLDLSSRGKARIDATRSAQLGRGLLRSQLEGALPIRYWTREGGSRVEHVAFEGTADRVRFVSRHGILDGPGSTPRWIELRLEQAPNDDRRLIAEERRILSPDNQPGEPSTRVDILSCADFLFEYLDTAGEKPQWVPTWSRPERSRPLPSAVRIRCMPAGQSSENSVKLLIPLDYADSAGQGMWLQ